MSAVQVTKRCPKCETEKAIGDFYASRTSKDGCQPACKACQAAYRRANPERARAWYAKYDRIHHEKKRAYRQSHPEVFRKASDKYRRGHAEELKFRRTEWYLANREKEAARQKVYRLANLEAVRERNKLYRRAHPETATEWAQKNPEKAKAILRRYRVANPGKNREASTAWQKRNPAKVAQNASRRRALRLSRAVGDPREANVFYDFVHGAPRIKCHWCGKNVKKGDRHVDHIFPLGGGGAHSVFNLCCACSKCNMKKSDKLPAEFTGQHELAFT